MRQVITFLGKYPRLTHYLFNGQVWPAEVFPQALRQFIAFDRMAVFTTKEAHASAWPVLERLHDPRICEVPIALGEDQDQMWGWLDAMIEQVSDGDVVIFDITHGLRSIPFLVFLFAAYLKTIRQVTIEAIYYGALELGDAQTGKPAPVLDLSQFVSMLDWITASDQFIQTGDARRLAALLQPKEPAGKASAQAAQVLTQVSQAAFLCQPFSLMKEVEKLPAALKQAELEVFTNARPFGVLNERVIQSFAPFRCKDCQDDRAVLHAEYQMIAWYAEKRQYLQMASLAREWLVDAVTFRLEKPLDYRSELRNLMERAISGLERIGRQEKDEQSGLVKTFGEDDLNEFGKQIYYSWPEWKQVRKLWSDLSAVRNTLDHAEHQRNPVPLKTTLKKVSREILPALKELADAWNLC